MRSCILAALCGRHLLPKILILLWKITKFALEDLAPEMTTLLLILSLIMFVGLVVVHEYGHFIMAKRGGVDVEEFGIGFPPRIWGKKTKGGWLFSLNLLPLGGFVRLKGENDADK